MAPANTCITNQLKQHIYHQLDNQFPKNALFLAERLVAVDHRSAESSFLLSICHLRLGDNRSAYEYSKPAGSRGAHLGCAYIFAQASLALERYKDGIVALEKSRGLWGGRNSFGKHSQFSRNPYPDAAAVNCLLGKLYYGYDDKKKCISYFEEALKLNPFMWDAFTTLCDMGVSVRVANIFKVSNEILAVLKSNQTESSTILNAKDASYLSPFPEHSQNRTGRPLPPSESTDPFNNVPPRAFNGGLFGAIGLSQKINESNSNISNMSMTGSGGGGLEAMETPTGPSASIDVTIVPSRPEPGLVSAYHIEPPQAPIRRNRTLQAAMDFSLDAPKISRAISTKRGPKSDPTLENLLEANAAIKAAASAAAQAKRTVSGHVAPVRPTPIEEPQQRRSERLFNQIRPRSSKPPTTFATVGPSQGRELKKSRPQISRIMRPSSTSSVSRIVSGARKASEDSMDVDAREFRPQSSCSAPAQVKPMDSEAAKQEDALRWLLDILKRLGGGYFALSHFQCHEALALYGSLPRAQQDTPWVLSQMGRAYFEQASYAEAEVYYKRVRAMAPTRHTDMELYSTVLWHLKREADLSFLAHELVDADWLSPQAWCALGNSWSLVRDHEQALRSFKRATQLSPKFAYAYTLQGHEHVSNEEYDKALVAYRQGLAADKRHYNAYYGVGRVYEKLGDLNKAFAHYRAASVINSTNAVLICCIGTILEKQKKPRQALQYFSKAADIAPRSALTRFKKARALMVLGEPRVALVELMVLKDLAPDEAMVHYLLGRLYKGLKEKGLAVRHFTIALNLDPKASQEIKSAIESLEHEDEEDDASMMA